MSEDNQRDDQTENVETLKAKITELEARIGELEEENQRLREALEKGVETLEEEIETQKATAIKTITEKTNFTKNEFEKMKLPALRLILKTIDSSRGTVKNMRSA